jgi:hypothetical protein
VSITASQLDRIIACPGSAALSQINTTSEYAQQGTDRHAEQEEAINSGDIPEDIAALLGDAAASAQAEVALAYDVATGKGRVIGAGLNRAYGELAPFEIAGSADVIACTEGGVIVIDRKLYSEVTPAAQNSQLAFLALAACRALGKSDATVILIYESGRVDRATLDEIDLDVFASKLRSLHERVAVQRAKVARGEVPDVSQGKHCKHCSSMPVCPASTALIQRLVNGGEANDLELMVPLTPDTARIAYGRLHQAKNLLKRIEAALYAYGAERPFPIGDGKMFGRYTKPGNEDLDGRIVRDVVREQLGEAAIDEVISYEATKTRLKEAIKARAPKGKAAAMERDLLAEVRKRGGAKREPSDAVGEFAPRLDVVKEEDAA